MSTILLLLKESPVLPFSYTNDSISEMDFQTNRLYRMIPHFMLRGNMPQPGQRCSCSVYAHLLSG